MNKSITVRNLLFLSILIYLGQGVFYTSGSLLSQSMLFLYLLFSAMYGFDYLQKKEKNIFGNLLLIFLTINVIYWMFSPRIINGYNSFINLKNNVFFILTFFPFYFLSKNKFLTVQSLKVFYIIIFIVYILQYYFRLNTLVDATGRENVVINNAYLFVSLLPLMGIFFKNKLIYLSLLSIALYMVIGGAKRGAILAFAIGSIVAFYFLVKDIERRNRFRNTIIVLIGLSVVIYYGYKQYLSNEFVQRRFELALEGNSSNRDIIYNDIFYGWFNSENLLSIFWGYGFNGSLKLTNSFAHNDWLEVLAGQGLFGIIIYFFLLYNIWKYYTTNKKYMDTSDKSICLSVLFIWILQSLFSTVYGGFFTFTYVLSLAFIMGKIDIKKRNISRQLYEVGKKIM